MDPIELLLWQLGGLALGVIVLVIVRELGRPSPVYIQQIANTKPPTMLELGARRTPTRRPTSTKLDKEIVLSHPLGQDGWSISAEGC